MSSIRTGLLSPCLFGEASYTWSFSHVSPSQMKMFRGVPSSLANRHLPQGAPRPSRAVAPAFLEPGTGFVEDPSSTDGWDGFRMIQACYI